MPLQQHSLWCMANSTTNGIMGVCPSPRPVTRIKMFYDCSEFLLGQPLQIFTRQWKVNVLICCLCHNWFPQVSSLSCSSWKTTPSRTATISVGVLLIACLLTFIPLAGYHNIRYFSLRRKKNTFPCSSFKGNSCVKLIPAEVLLLGSFLETEGEGTKLHNLLPGNLRRIYWTCMRKAK